MAKRDNSTKTIRIDPELWDKFKIFCIKNKLSIKEKLEELITEELIKKDENNFEYINIIL